MQLASTMVGVAKNADAIKPAIDELISGHIEITARDGEAEEYKGSPYPGSIASAEFHAKKLLEDLHSARGSDDPGTFETFVDRVQSLIGEVNSLNSSLSSSSFGARSPNSVSGVAQLSVAYRAILGEMSALAITSAAGGHARPLHDTCAWRRYR
jgi:hypothetical protein